MCEAAAPDLVVLKFSQHPNGVHEHAMLQQCAGVEGVPAVFWCGRARTMGGVDVLARAYVPGPCLDRAVVTAAVVASLRSTLRLLHERGVVYRDVKPSNIVVEESTGRPVLIDFDCADEVGALGFAGTERFASQRTLQHRRAKPRDDFDSLQLTLAWCAGSGENVVRVR